MVVAAAQGVGGVADAARRSKTQMVAARSTKTGSVTGGCDSNASSFSDWRRPDLESCSDSGSGSIHNADVANGCKLERRATLRRSLSMSEDSVSVSPAASCSIDQRRLRSRVRRHENNSPSGYHMKM